MSRLGFTESDLKKIDVHTMLAQVGGYYRHELSDFDSMMWARAIELYGDMPVKRFLVHHIESAGPKDDFFPKVGAFFRFIDPSANNALAAFEELREQVSRCGPWRSPVFRSPAIVRAVQSMGGWVQVNKELPSPEADRFGYEAFYKRFEAAYTVACSEVALMSGAKSERLLGLHSLKALEQKPEIVGAVEFIPGMATNSSGEAGGINRVEVER
jgi:hypothetical protein